MKKKRFLVAILTVAMMMAFAPAGAVAMGGNVMGGAAPGDWDPAKVTVILDGKVVDFEDTYARAIYNRTYVPLTKIITILTGEGPAWNDAERSATFPFNGKTYKIYMAQSGIYIDGKFNAFEVGAEIRDNRMMIPLKMMSDALGFGIEWDGATRIVRMTSPQQLDVAASVLSVSPKIADIVSGEKVTATVTASSNTTEVKITGTDGKTVASGKTYTTSGANRQFTLSFTPATAGKYHVYAANENGYNMNTYLDITVKLEDAVTIYDAYANPSSIHSDDKANLYVQTSTNVTSITYSVTAGKGTLKESRQTSGYRDTNGKRIWSGNVYYAGDDGTNKISVTALTASGDSASSSISVKVTTVASESGHILECNDMYGWGFVAPDNDETFTIITEKDVSRLSFSGNYVKGSLTELKSAVKNPDGTLGWQIQLTTPNSTNLTLKITAYDENSLQSDSVEYSFPIIWPDGEW